LIGPQATVSCHREGAERILDGSSPGKWPELVAVETVLRAEWDRKEDIS